MERGEPSFQRVGRFELIRKIATGGMAELFLARFTGPGGFEKRCALKRILPQFAEDEEFTRMFLNEAKVAAMFDHPNLAQIFELGTDDATGQHFIAMELINGMDLRQLQRMCRDRGEDVPAEIAAYMMVQALDGLAYAHEFRDPNTNRPLHLVHRDVSPQNILVSFEGAIKLVDFGIVKANTTEGHTQTGMLKGKIAYMSPEQATGEKLDARSDVFSIGAVLYELVTGVKPFRATTEIMTLKAILELDPQPITHFVPDCPQGIEKAIYRSLSKRREDRHQNAREFQVDLLNTLRSCPVPLDRHVLAQYVRALTETEHDRFDATQLKIPRALPAPDHSSTPRYVAPTPAPTSPNDPNVETFRREAQAVFQSALDAPSIKRRSQASQEVPAMVPPATLVPPHAGPTPAPQVSSAPRPMAPNIAVATASNSGTHSGLYPRGSVDLSVIDEARAAGIGGGTKKLLILFLVLIGSGLAFGTAMLFLQPEEPTVITALPSATVFEPPQEKKVPPPVEQKAAEQKPVEQKVVEQKPVEQKPVVTQEPAKAVDREPHKEAARDRESAKEKRDRKKEEREAKREAKEREAVKEKAPPPSGGTLTLNTVPRGLIVKLGDKKLGTTPLEDVELPPGKHTLSLTQSKLGIARTVTVEIKKDQKVDQTITIGKGTVKVNSRPWADVYIDGQLAGKTPLQRPVYEGKHEIKLVNPEEGERIQIIDVSNGEEEDVRVKF